MEGGGRGGGLLLSSLTPSSPGVEDILPVVPFF